MAYDYDGFIVMVIELWMILAINIWISITNLPLFPERIRAWRKESPSMKEFYRVHTTTHAVSLGLVCSQYLSIKYTLQATYLPTYLPTSSYSHPPYPCKSLSYAIYPPSLFPSFII